MKQPQFKRRPVQSHQPSLLMPSNKTRPPTGTKKRQKCCLGKTRQDKKHLKNLLHSLFFLEELEQLSVRTGIAVNDLIKGFTHTWRCLGYKVNPKSSPGEAPESHPQILAAKPSLIPTFWRGLDRILTANLQNNKLWCRINLPFVDNKNWAAFFWGNHLILLIFSSISKLFK